MKKEDSAPAETPEPTESRVNAIIDRWFLDHFPNSPVARDTDAWNHTVAAKDDLKRRIQEEN